MIDAKLKQILPFRYDSFWSVFDKNGLIKVEIQDGRKHYWGLVNTKGVEIVSAVYERIDEHLNGTYTVKKDGKKFTIDKIIEKGDLLKEHLFQFLDICLQKFFLGVSDYYNEIQ